MSPRSKFVLPVVLIAALARAAGCGSAASPQDAGVVSGPATGFSGPISPTGGTITGVFGSGGLSGGSNGGKVYISIGDCPAGQTQVSLGSGSGYACASAGTPSTASSGDILVQGSGELDPYAGSACPMGQLVQSIDSAGDLGCSLPIASNACGSGWAAAIGSDGSLGCTVPTPAGLNHVVCYTTLTTGTVNDWSPTCAGGVSAAAADVWTVTSASGMITLTGIDSSLAGSDGGTKLILNQSGQQIQITNAGAGSLAADRFVTINAYTRYVGNDGSFQATYQGSAQLWTEHDESSRYTNNLYDEGSTTVVGSVTAASAAITSAITAGSTAFRADGNGVSYAPSGSDVYANYQLVGYNSTFHVVSTFFDDGQGAGSAGHAIVLFDAHTHSLRIGSAGSANPADIESSAAAPSGGCGSGSIDQDYATNGTLYACDAGGWYPVASLSSVSANTLVMGGSTAGTLVNSSVTDSSGTTSVGDAFDADGGTANINGLSSGHATHVGNSTSGITTVNSGVAVELCQASASTAACYLGNSTSGQADLDSGSGIAIGQNSGAGVAISVGTTSTGQTTIIGGSGVVVGSVFQSAPVSIISAYTGSGAFSVVTAGSDHIEADAGSIYLIADQLVFKGNGAPSVSCTSGTATCASGATCSDSTGVLNLSSATGCTMTFYKTFNSTPACTFTAVGSSSLNGWFQIQTQSATAVKFSLDSTSGFLSISATADYVCLGTN